MSQLDRFELLDKLGENQHGTVYKAYESDLERFVAVLELDDRFSSDMPAWNKIWEGMLQRVGLKHEYLVAVYGVDKERRWVVMEFMNGNLGDTVSLAPLSGDVVRTVLRRALEALDWLHKNGAVHGNVKPATLLYDREGFIKLAFSPGFEFGDQVPSNRVAAKYFAPELMRSDVFGPVGAAVDLYCLGISALELLLGPRFDDLVKGGGKDAPDPNIAWTRWHSSDEPAPKVRSLVPNVPADLEAVIDSLLKKHVASRIPSAKQAMSLLDATARDVSIEVPPSRVDRPTGGTVVPRPIPPTGAAGRKAPAQPKEVSVGAKKAGAQNKRPISWTTRVLAAILVAVASLLVFAIFLSRSGHEVAISSQPDNAAISLFRVENDNRIPVELADRFTPGRVKLPPGKYECRLQKAGYQDATKPLEVPSGADDASGSSDELLFTLVPTKLRTVHIVSEPSGALISVVAAADAGKSIADGSGSLKTPAEIKLPAGQYQLHLELEGYPTQSHDVQVPDGDSALELEPFKFASVRPPLVRIHFKPKDLPQLSLTINDKKVKAEPANPYEWTLEPDQQSLRITAEARGFEPKIVVLSRSDLLQKKEVTLELTPSKASQPVLLGSLRAVGDKRDKTSGRPLRIGCAKINDVLRKGDVPCEFVLVPPGRFTAGAKDPHMGELPATEKTIDSPYYIAVAEVTNAQYEVFFKDVGPKTSGTAWQQAGATSGESRNQPAVNISFQQAADFCRWLTDTEESRLPTELEWEYAARFKNENLVPGNVALDSSAGVFNLRAADDRTDGGRPVRVDSMEGGRTTEPVVLYHMLGNVWEWCSELYEPGKGDELAPGVRRWHVVRGASFRTPIQRARLTSRSNHDDPGGSDIGFRPVVALGSAGAAMKPSLSSAQGDRADR